MNNKLKWLIEEIKLVDPGYYYIKYIELEKQIIEIMKNEYNRNTQK